MLNFGDVSFLPSRFVSSERKLAEISSWLRRLQAASSIYGAPMARKGKGMLVLLVVRSKSGEKTSWGKGRLPCYLQGFSYISGGLFRISSINLSLTCSIHGNLPYISQTFKPNLRKYTQSHGASGVWTNNNAPVLLYGKYQPWKAARCSFSERKVQEFVG